MTRRWNNLRYARTLLFVPGHRPDRFSKAAVSGADDIVLDLEDAVAPDSKKQARENIRLWLTSGRGGIVRINAHGSPWHAEDVKMLSRFQCAILLSKTSSADEVESVRQALIPGSCILPLVETAAGIQSLPEICSLKPLRLVFGNADLARELGIDHSDINALVHYRSQLILASAASDLPPPVDGVTTALYDIDKVADDATHARSLGFGGKLCLHPRQVATVNSIFTPSDEQLAWATNILAAAAGDGSVGSFDGQIVGKPIVERARMLLSRARH